MFAEKRWITTSVYFAAMAMTIVSAVVLKNVVLTLIFLLI